MSQSAAHPQLESVPCFLCGADDYDIVYEARYDREKDEVPTSEVGSRARSDGDGCF